MVKCCIFMIGLVFLIGGLASLAAGIYNTWFYAEFRPGLIIGPIFIFLGILLLYYGGYKMEFDEEQAEKKMTIKRREEYKRADIARRKEIFLQQKEWEKELESGEANFLFCGNCGKKLTSQQNYCDKCGTPKSQSSS